MGNEQVKPDSVPGGTAQRGERSLASSQESLPSTQSRPVTVKLRKSKSISRRITNVRRPVGRLGSKKKNATVTGAQKTLAELVPSTSSSRSSSITDSVDSDRLNQKLDLCSCRRNWSQFKENKTSSDNSSSCGCGLATCDTNDVNPAGPWVFRDVDKTDEVSECDKDDINFHYTYNHKVSDSTSSHPARSSTFCGGNISPEISLSEFVSRIKSHPGREKKINIEQNVNCTQNTVMWEREHSELDPFSERLEEEMEKIGSNVTVAGKETADKTHAVICCTNSDDDDDGSSSIFSLQDSVIDMDSISVCEYCDEMNDPPEHCVSKHDSVAHMSVAPTDAEFPGESDSSGSIQETTNCKGHPLTSFLTSTDEMQYHVTVAKQGIVGELKGMQGTTLHGCHTSSSYENMTSIGCHGGNKRAHVNDGNVNRAVSCAIHGTDESCLCELQKKDLCRPTAHVMGNKGSMELLEIEKRTAQLSFEEETEGEVASLDHKIVDSSLPWATKDKEESEKIGELSDECKKDYSSKTVKFGMQGTESFLLDGMMGAIQSTDNRPCDKKDTGRKGMDNGVETFQSCGADALQHNSIAERSLLHDTTVNATKNFPSPVNSHLYEDLQAQRTLRLSMAEVSDNSADGPSESTCYTVQSAPGSITPDFIESTQQIRAAKMKNDSTHPDSPTFEPQKESLHVLKQEAEANILVCHSDDVSCHHTQPCFGCAPQVKSVVARTGTVNDLLSVTDITSVELAIEANISSDITDVMATYNTADEIPAVPKDEGMTTEEPGLMEDLSAPVEGQRTDLEGIGSSVYPTGLCVKATAEKPSAISNSGKPPEDCGEQCYCEFSEQGKPSADLIWMDDLNEDKNSASSSYVSCDTVSTKKCVGNGHSIIDRTETPIQSLNGMRCLAQSSNEASIVQGESEYCDDCTVMSNQPAHKSKSMKSPDVEELEKSLSFGKAKGFHASMPGDAISGDRSTVSQEWRPDRTTGTRCSESNEVRMSGVIDLCNESMLGDGDTTLDSKVLDSDGLEDRAEIENIEYMISEEFQSADFGTSLDTNDTLVAAGENGREQWPVGSEDVKVYQAKNPLCDVLGGEQALEEFADLFVSNIIETQVVAMLAELKKMSKSADGVDVTAGGHDSSITETCEGETSQPDATQSQELLSEKHGQMMTEEDGVACDERVEHNSLQDSECVEPYLISPSGDPVDVESKASTNQQMKEWCDSMGPRQADGSCNSSSDATVVTRQGSMPNEEAVGVESAFKGENLGFNDDADGEGIAPRNILTDKAPQDIPTDEQSASNDISDDEISKADLDEEIDHSIVVTRVNLNDNGKNDAVEQANFLEKDAEEREKESDVINEGLVASVEDSSESKIDHTDYGDASSEQSSRNSTVDFPGRIIDTKNSAAVKSDTSVKDLYIEQIGSVTTASMGNIENKPRDNVQQAGSCQNSEETGLRQTPAGFLSATASDNNQVQEGAGSTDEADEVSSGDVCSPEYEVPEYTEIDRAEKQKQLIAKGKKLLKSKLQMEKESLKWKLPAGDEVATNYGGLSTSISLLSRRGSDDLTSGSELSVRELKDALAEMEEKYLQAMVQNAQLDNERTQLNYRVEQLKDSIEEQEDELYRIKKECKEKCQELERDKRLRDALQKKFVDLQEALRQRDELIQEQGLVMVGGNGVVEDDEDGYDGGRQYALVTTEAAQVLQSAGEGSLDDQLKHLAEEKQDLYDQVRRLKAELEEERKNNESNLNSEPSYTENGVADMQLLEIQREASRQISEFKFKLQKAEQEIGSYQANVTRLESQLQRYKATSEVLEKSEDEIRAEKRKLQRDLRAALDRIEEMEMTNAHLEKRLERMRASRSAQTNQT